MNLFLKTSLPLAFLWLLTVAMVADTITGRVVNQTTGQPAAGDEVVLLRLGEGMQVEARTKTNDQGVFTLNIASRQAPHLIQVSHQGVNYDLNVSGASPVEITVYDAVANIPGLEGPIGIVQVESEGEFLKVTEMYDITNTSNPPVTQSRADNFEITVPAGAVFGSVEVRRGQGIWLKVAPALVKGQKRKYRINFPIRPGDTLFRAVYHFPYKGPTTFHIRLPYPIQNFGVMHPPSMTFKALLPGTFMSPGVTGGLAIEKAVTTPLVGDVPAFEISGIGTAPEQATQAAPPSPPVVSAPPSSAHPAQNIPPSPANHPGQELWPMIAGIIGVLGVGAFTLWRMKTRRTRVLVSTSTDVKKPALDALKEELFQLESDRLHGAISAEQYATTKRALSESIQRAMDRK